MEEKNVQSNAELNEEQLEQTAGGMNFLGFTFTCPQCGKEYANPPFSCTCGKIFAVQPE